MKTSSTWNFRSIFGKIMLGIVLTAMVGSIDVAPALSKDEYRRTEKHDNGRYDQRGRGYDNDRYVHGRRVYRRPGYRRRVYVSPPVIYAPLPPPVIYAPLPPPVIFVPPPPPGISIFFPPFFFHP